MVGRMLGSRDRKPRMRCLQSFGAHTFDSCDLKRRRAIKGHEADRPVPRCLCI